MAPRICVGNFRNMIHVLAQKKSSIFFQKKSLKIRADKFLRFLDERNRNISHALTATYRRFIHRKHV